MSRRVLVIGAHSADFVWRAGGAVAVAVEHGGTAEVVALSYGERGESGELWKQEGQTVENVKSIRHDEAEAAADGARRDASAAWTSATTRCRSTPTRCSPIADAIRAFAPDVLITHTDRDPFNPDHPVASVAVDRARGLAAGAGVPERLRHHRAAGPVPVRAPPARAVQLHPDDVRRHHARVRAQAGGDGAR